MASYQAPPWARPPATTEWRLIEIKSGVEVATHSLQKATTLLGRAADQVDITLAHESCSRCHARIAFDESSTAWLRDLQSAHGTTVNKKRIPPQACGMEESMSTKPGSRGVVLYPGDVIQFGASSRLYSVEGPSSASRTAVKVQQATRQQAQRNATSLPEGLADNRDDDEGVSWGMDMDDAVAMDTTLSIDVWDDKIPPEYRAEWERLKALKMKLEHVILESERIRRKGDLTDGQERQLARNTEREGDLTHEVAEKEAELWHKLHPQAKAPRADKGMPEDDEVDDRAAEKESAIDEEGETEETLIRKWKLAWSQLEVLDKDKSKANVSCSHMKQKVADLEAAGDEDAFFAQNDLTLAQEKLQSLSDQQRKTMDMLQEVERLLKIVNPKLTIDQVTGYIGLGPAPSLVAPEVSSTETKVQPPSAFFEPVIPEVTQDGFVMPAPKRQLDTAPHDAAPHDAAPLLPPPPPPKRKRVLGPSMPPPKQNDAAKPAMAAPAGTLATLMAASSSTAAERDQRLPKPVARTKDESNPSTTGPMATVIDTRSDKWIKPKDQDGSGLTKLNAKFAGRY